MGGGYHRLMFRQRIRRGAAEVRSTPAIIAGLEFFGVAILGEWKYLQRIRYRWRSTALEAFTRQQWQLAFVFSMASAVTSIAMAIRSDLCSPFLLAGVCSASEK